MLSFGSCPYTWSEAHIYGSDRIGILNINLPIVEDNERKIAEYLLDTVFTHILAGMKKYELTNHLGNVLSVITDRRLYEKGDDGSQYFVPDVVSATDYYPFGWAMPGRTYTAASYKYGFNGKENDNEVKGEGNQQDYGMRIYDPRLGRFLSVDPLAKSYPFYTPYQFAGNRPINSIDMDGGEPKDAYKGWNAFSWGQLYRSKGFDENFYTVRDNTTKQDWYVTSKQVNLFGDKIYKYMDPNHQEKGYQEFNPDGYQKESSTYKSTAIYLSKFGTYVETTTRFLTYAFASGGLYAGGATGGAIINTSLTVGGINATADALVQLGVKRDIKQVNFFASASQGILQNPVTSAWAGNAVNISYNTVFGTESKFPIFDNPVKYSMESSIGSVGNVLSQSFNNWFKTQSGSTSNTVNNLGSFTGNLVGNTIGATPAPIKNKENKK
jgi:RHS repeat-associated protein